MTKFIKNFPDEIYLECKILFSEQVWNFWFFEGPSVKNVGFVDRTLTDLEDDGGFITYQGIEYCLILRAFGKWYVGGSSPYCTNIIITAEELRKLRNGESIRKYGPMG